MCDQRRDHRTALSVAALTLIAGLFYCYRLGALPVYVWDEARVAVNALEMLGSGHLLVTTYNGAPDLWNTKPPLAIWLEVASMRVLGVSEFALRMPSAVAAAVTTAIVYAFTWRASGSRLAGLMAALVLMGCFGYTGVHVARTADYDALLTLFTTAAAFALWVALETSERPAPGWLLLTGVAIALALLTKGIAGALILPGLAVFVVLKGHAAPLAKSPAAWLAASVAVVLPVAFYVAREDAAPGFLRAVAENELGSRFTQSIAGGAPKPWFFYLQGLVSAFTPVLTASAFPWSNLLPISAYLSLTSKVPPVRSASLLCALILAAFLAVISTAATRVAWYVAPAFPFIAVLTALGAHRIWLSNRPKLDRYAPEMRAFALLAVASAVVVIVVVRNNHTVDLASQQKESRAALAAREALASRPNGPVRILHDGYGEINGRPYVGSVEFYAKASRLAGRDVRVERSTYRPTPGETVVWCQADLDRPFSASGAELQSSGACRTVLIK